MDEASTTSDAATDPGGLETRRARRSARRNEALAERLLRRGVAGRTGLGATLALALSLLVVTLTVLCVVGGVAVAVLGRHSPLLVGLGLILAVTAVAVFPRPVRLGEGDVLLDRSQAAQFWELLFEIAHALRTQPPELVVVDMEPNTSVSNVGHRSRTVLRLGAPLWAILDGQERVGLLAHELGHLAHGDPRRGRVVALAMQTLAQWWLALTPPPTTRPDGLMRWIEDVMLAGLRRVVRLWIDVIARLQTSAVQRAELRSDHAAAHVAGWTGYTALLKRLRYSERLGHAVHVAAARRDGVDFYTSLTGTLDSLPPEEDERLRRLAAREPYDRNLTHPPARLRLRAVEDMDAEGGLVVPDAARWASIDAELAPVLASLAQRAREDHDAKQDRYAGIRPPRARRATAPRP